MNTNKVKRVGEAIDILIEEFPFSTHNEVLAALTGVLWPETDLDQISNSGHCHDPRGDAPEFQPIE